MRVRALHDLEVRGEFHRAGDIFEMTDDDAESAIADDMAEPVDNTDDPDY